MSVLIKLEGVEKTYHVGNVEVCALRGVNLSINKGEFLSILGPSGSGKSTLLNSIGCLDVPTRGKIHLGEFDIGELGESELAQIRGKKIGFVFQSFNLIPSLTALRNVMLPMIFQKEDPQERIKRAHHLLGLVGLSERISHRPSELSGGQMQRVAIARALANDPEVILADEPTGNLDSKTEKEIIELFRNIHKKEKKTVVMITHNLGLTKYAQRVVHLKDGRIEK
ncbi:MAG: ABC transporter ATP-binding protein [Nanoarchaeota archaeon]|nr:ABC transporter ATP-binding protein [Nanoarchaeota archaeon]